MKESLAFMPKHNVKDNNNILHLIANNSAPILLALYAIR
jgi:hypothetical protein